MKNPLLLTLLFLSPMCLEAAMIVSVVTVPENTNGYFIATVAGGPNPGQPNPCWERGPSCRIGFYTIDESWLPGGLQNYSTSDDVGFKTPQPADTYESLSSWWASVTDKNRQGRDYLPPGQGETP
ncbi:Uncharacterised protein [Serratia quinivorans]|nr:Uncharacterised protein [Serratia quinivorans]